MTAAEWLQFSFERPKDAQEALQQRASNRKLRLYACACSRKLWRFLTDERSRKAVEVAELSCDRLANEREVQEARQVARVVCSSFRIAYGTSSNAWRAAIAAAMAAAQAPPPLNYFLRDHVERSEMATLLEEVFHLSFVQCAIDTAIFTWRDGTIPKLAQAAYDERELPSGHLDAGKLAILADALEEAGCTSEDVLRHLRGPGPHVRGCWVVDLLLGKE